jgi:hypothetical protein
LTIPPFPETEPVKVVVAPVAPMVELVITRVSLSVTDAPTVTLFVAVFVPPEVNDAVPLATSNVRDPPVPFESVKPELPLFVTEILPTVIPVLRLTVCAAVGLLKVADAPTELGNPVVVQFPLTFQLDVPDVELNVCPKVAGAMKLVHIPANSIDLNARRRLGLRDASDRNLKNGLLIIDNLVA